MTRDYDLPPADVLHALGTLLVAFSELEETMHFALTHPFGERMELASVLASATMFKQSIAKFGSLYRALRLRNDASEQVKGFCDELEKLNDRRNELVHAIWLTLDGGEVRRGSRKPSAAKGMTSQSKPITSTEILALADAFDAASDKLLTFALAADSPAPHAALS